MIVCRHGAACQQLVRHAGGGVAGRDILAKIIHAKQCRFEISRTGMSLAKASHALLIKPNHLLGENHV
jgi:hypothetical protein